MRKKRDCEVADIHNTLERHQGLLGREERITGKMIISRILKREILRGENYMKIEMEKT